MSSQPLAKSQKRLSLFDDFFKPLNERLGSFNDLWENAMTSPPVNIAENNNEFHISFAVPGMKKEDFHIDMDSNILTVSCEKETEKEEKEKKYTRKEYSYSSFSRSFTLPDEVNKDKIDAKYENGVLQLVLPRKEEAKMKSKQIAVK